MNQNDKFDMLSVVAFGIHTKVRKMLEEEVAKAAADTDLRDVLRPFFFYEYFLDPPVVFGEDPTASVAFAPFLGRLAAQSDFMPVPFLGGYKAAKGIKREEAEELSRTLLAQADLRVPATRSNINAYWSEHVVFQEAIIKSDVLKLLYRFWQNTEASVPLRPTRAQVRAAIEQCRNALTGDDKKPYVEVLNDFADYADGIVSISAGWSRPFATEAIQHLLDRYERDSIDNALREFFTCIYPWLQDRAGKARPPKGNERLFELLTCSISSRRVFFGELILIYPPIANADLRTRAAQRLRSVLHRAAVDLYVPMLTLYENFAAESDLKDEVFEDLPLRDASTSGSDMDADTDEDDEKPEVADVDTDDDEDEDEEKPEVAGVDTDDDEDEDADLNALKDEWKAELTARFAPGRWSGLQPFLRDIGRYGASEKKMPPWPAEIVSSEFVDPTVSPFFKLVQFIPPATEKLLKKLKKLRRILESRGDGSQLLQEAQAKNKALADCLNKTDTRIGVRAWSSVFEQHVQAITAWAAASVKDTDVEGVRRNILNDARDAECVLSDMELALARLWAHRLAVIHDEPWAVEESLVFAEYLIASPGMIKCIRDAIRICHSISDKPKKQKVQTALVVGGPGSGKDSMARLVHLFSPGYRFGTQSTLNMGMFRPKELAVPLLLGLGATVESGGKPDRSSLGLTGVLKQALLTTADVTAGSVEQGYSFILDELNSLDIDTQGALLRVFENSELLPLGSMTKDRIAFLFVGVMNEDPELIMKKRALDSILRDQTLLGGLLGEAMYEMFRNQRRLRDDLYYRLARGGEIRIPDLRERREDLPILTYFIVKGYLDDSSVDGRIDLAVYEELLDPGLGWQGNIRELQALCRRLVDAALADGQLAPDGCLEILRSHALHALGRMN